MSWGQEWGGPWGGPAGFDYRDIVRRRLWKYLDRLPNFRATMNDIAVLWNMLDDQTRGVIASVGVETARDDELDEWGLLVGLPRLGADDALYRRSIKAAARRLLAGGTLGDFYDIVELVSPGTKVSIGESFPAGIMIWIHAISPIEQSIVASLFAGVPGRGIGAGWIQSDEKVFTWGSADVPVPVNYHWGSADGGVPDDQTAGWGSANVIQ
jgi:hypothetical protein